MEFKYVDNHAHLNFKIFDEDYRETIKRAHDANVAVINVGTQKDTSKCAVEIADEFENGVYAIIGLHPVHTSKSFHDEKEIGEGGKEFTSRGESFDYEYYKNLAENPKVVGIGECGLDYFRLEENTKEIQKKIFEEQVELAIEVDKPLMLHIRDSGTGQAYYDALEILNTLYLIHNTRLRGNVHFFVGSKEIAKEFLDLGFTLSFTGVITFAKGYEELVKFIPLDRILSETDCPYVPPVPYRGKRNEPVYVIEVIKKIAEIKNLSFEEVSEQLLKNSKKLFKL